MIFGMLQTAALLPAVIVKYNLFDFISYFRSVLNDFFFVSIE